jgi:acetoin utilization deacetylase AcuC-like enzyme
MARRIRPVERAMRRFGLVVDPVFEEHETGPGHPERPERLRAVRSALSEAGLLRDAVVVPPVAANDAMLERAHAPEHVRNVEAACERGERWLDAMDTAISPPSARVARLAAGTVTELARRVARGDLDAGFAAVRPPGHHAERDLAMGFCLFNNVVVASRALQAEEGVGRVLIVDWDVHHGNGTQHILERDPDTFYFSVHQWPLYPGTGARHERGLGPGRGATLNCPLPPGSGDDAFLAALGDDLVAAADAFRPDFVIVSAGFDAHRADPLAQLEVTTSAYAEAAHIVREVAERHGRGRIVSVLEGGYDLDALGASVVAHLRALTD